MPTTCEHCGGQIQPGSSQVCPTCGAGVAMEEDGAIDGGLSFLTPEQTQQPSPFAVTDMTRDYWDSEPLKCKTFTLGPYISKYKVHATCSYPGGKLGGDVSITTTGLEFTSGKHRFRFYYRSISRVRKVSSSTFGFTADDGTPYEIKAVNPNEWIDQIMTMKGL